MILKVRLFLLSLLISSSSIAGTIDSIGVENLEGKQLILHKVSPKESYYSLGRKYGVNPAAIIDYNRNKALGIGTLVKIPTQRPFVAPSLVAKPTTQPIATDDVLEYAVKPKETLFSISKKFNISIKELKDFNKLTVNSLRVGQVLKIKGRVEPVTTVNAAPKLADQMTLNTDTTTKVPMAESAELDRKLPAAKYGLREIKERGLASWMDDESLDSGRMLALHPTAPVGTIIKITNPMTQKSTFAKVVGKFTENELNKGLIIILTKTAAELIGAVDKRFQVNLIYGIPNEQ